MKRKELVISSGDIKDITVIFSKRSKNICIQVRPIEGVRVVAPCYASMRDIESALSRRREWISRCLEKASRIREGITVFNDDTKFQTRAHRLVLMSHDGPVSSRISDGLIRVKYPKEKSITDNDVQSFIRASIDRALKIEARDYIPYRVKGISKRLGLAYSDIKLKNAKTRWGSCSSRNNLNFNIQLMRLPDHLIDYVIMHELAHTVERNHGAKFWSLLDGISGDAKKLDRELKSYRIGLW